MSVLSLHDHKVSADASRLRQAIALPIYTLALVLEVAATALARRDRRRRLAGIAADHGPRRGIRRNHFPVPRKPARNRDRLSTYP
jgi:hypothetical protein